MKPSSLKKTYLNPKTPKEAESYLEYKYRVIAEYRINPENLEEYIMLTYYFWSNDSEHVRQVKLTINNDVPFQEWLEGVEPTIPKALSIKLDSLRS